MIKTRTRYYVSLGSNINRQNHLICGVSFLRASFLDVTCSPVYQSPAYGFKGPDFYNMVVGFDSTIAPIDLKKWTRRLELICGRRPQQRRYSNRLLDIDILLAGQLLINHKNLRIPRPELCRRAYVLKPLYDLSPQLNHPETGRSLASLWQRLDQQEASSIQKLDSRNWFN